MKTKSRIHAVMMSALCCTAAFAGSADERLAQIGAAHTRDALDRGGWENTVLNNSTYAAANQLRATRIGDGATSVAGRPAGISADEQLGRILASFNREMLDRGGWQNTFLSNSRYASGNALLAVQVGEGVTLGGAANPSEGTRAVALNDY